MDSNLQNTVIVFLIIFDVLWFYSSTLSCEQSNKLIVSTKNLKNTTSTLEDVSYNHSNWLEQIKQHELRIYSQNGEDGVLLWIFTNIGTINKPPRFVEFGTEKGLECNTRFLRQQLGWQGLMMDGTGDNPEINLHKENITIKNINDLLAKYQTPSLIDLLSIDIDFDDYFVWKSILQANRFHARVVVIEYNYEIPVNENRVVDPYQDSRRWTKTIHYGASMLAMAALGRAYNYTLIYVEKNAVNLFFIQTSILIERNILHKVPSIKELYISEPYTPRKSNPELDKTRRWIWNDTIWI
ncbi:unnamed protein product [Adineta steineri]|uniref:Methyltransferase FkbM domain-containing protein n=1 Tax=Adineta steineri TaxID=433720 RepID=A0A815SCC0_9BILA|nr:unnamed protein product [Adineta steineri]CAF1641260.1 unnamed protein product [Adineta steineri]